MPMKSRKMPMNMGGWWANTTTPTRNSTCSTTTQAGIASVGVPASPVFSAPSSLRHTNTTTAAFTTTASAAFQPNWVSMKAKSQFHFAATISTGGAANGVSTPPIETLTNRVPSSAYFARVEMPTAYTRRASSMAASVIAAGSVMNDPSSGTSASTLKQNSRPLRQGSRRASPSTMRVASHRIGRVPAITMIANTNMGSVKLRDSTYPVAADGPASTIMTTMDSMAQAPNTISTSASRCQMPECAGWRSARRWKYLVLKV